MQVVKETEEVLGRDIDQYGVMSVPSNLSKLLSRPKSANNIQARLDSITGAIERQTSAQRQWRVEEVDDECLRYLQSTNSGDNNM